MEKQSVECRLVPFKRYAKVYTESSCDELCGGSDDGRFSCWKPSQDLSAGWCSEQNESYANENNAQVGSFASDNDDDDDDDDPSLP